MPPTLLGLIKMANRSRISISLPYITAKLIKHQPHVYADEDLSQLFLKGKKKWNLPAAMNSRKFVEALEYEGIINSCHLDFGTEWHEAYYLTSCPDYYVVSQMIRNSYVSHATALAFWKMTDVVQDQIYVNREQSQALSKLGKGILVQSGIDGAFKGAQRQTASISNFDGKQVVLVKGKSTNQLGVIEADLKGKEQIRITDPERTLIDCVVRPAYATGPEEMAAIFKKAKSLISVATLADYLNELDYTYPYHQSIGFYLEKAGNYSDSEIDLFRTMPIEFDFYLDYGMSSPAYSKKWKLYAPAPLQ